MLRERNADGESSWSIREADDERARWLSDPLVFECERPRPSSALLRVRDRDERPPIIELSDMRPNVPDMRDGHVPGGCRALVGQDPEHVRVSHFEHAWCCFRPV